MAGAMFVLGVILLLGGVAWISVPAAVAVAGLLLVVGSVDMADSQ